MKSKISQFLQSRYTFDKQGDYGYFACNRRACKGRLISFVDIFAQLGRGLASTVGALVLVPIRLGITIGSAAAIPVAAIINGIQCIYKREKSSEEIFWATRKISRIAWQNANMLFSFPVVLAIDLSARFALIGADAIGVALPQVGQKARTMEKKFSKAIAFEENDFAEKNSVNKIRSFILKHIWPRADKLAFAAST